MLCPACCVSLSFSLLSSCCRWLLASPHNRGFGTVRFASKEDADAACEKLNNTEYEGRTITVRLDRFA